MWEEEVHDLPEDQAVRVAPEEARVWKVKAWRCAGWGSVTGMCVEEAGKPPERGGADRGEGGYPESRRGGSGVGGGFSPWVSV